MGTMRPISSEAAAFLLGFVGAAFFVDVAENFELRLHDLQLAVAVRFDFAVEREHLSGLKTVLQDRSR